MAPPVDERLRGKRESGAAGARKMRGKAPEFNAPLPPL
jgi:hypothetical protein